MGILQRGPILTYRSVHWLRAHCWLSSCIDLILQRGIYLSDSFDPHKILGISPGASLEEIRRAYRRQAAKYHPDAGGDAWVFQQIQSAYAQLVSHTPATSASQEKQQDHRDHRSKDVEGNSHGQENTLRQWLFGKPLKLHNETSYFVFANFMDLVMTGILLRNDAMEVNPIADLIYQFWGFGGLVAFKISIVVFVCVIAQWIARRSMSKARILLVGGTLLVAAVVVYSMWLARYQLGVF